MTALVDARPRLAAVKAAIAAEAGTVVYDHSEVPGTFGIDGPMPPIFVLVALERRASPLLRSARAGDAGWRVLVTCLGTTVRECEWALAKVAAALNEQRLTVESAATTPLQFESSTAPRYDDGRFAADAFYTFVR